MTVCSCACGVWRINVTVYPEPPEGLVDPCPVCGTSQYSCLIEEDDE